MARTQTIVQLTSEMVEALDLEAHRTGASRSALIREAVDAYLAGSRDAAITAELVEAYRRTPQGAADGWGDIRGATLGNTRRTLQRLDAEEESAGLEW